MSDNGQGEPLPTPTGRRTSVKVVEGRSSRRASSLREQPTGEEEERGDHLKTLVRKHKMAMAKFHQSMRDMGVKISKTESRTVAEEEEEVSEMEVDEEVGEMTAEVEAMGGKVKEIHQLLSSAGLKVTKDGVSQYPLEVKVQDLSYDVSVQKDDGNGSGAHYTTVYTGSFLYPIVQGMKRMWRGEPICGVDKTTKKTILSNINLNFQPGKSYLLLGPPGSGTTLFSLLRCPTTFVSFSNIRSYFDCNRQDDIVESDCRFAASRER